MMFINKTKITSSIRYFLLFCISAAGLISIIATGGGGGGGSVSIGDSDGTVTETGTGTLSISMGDSITDDLSAVWVTIEEVSVHQSVDENNEGDEQENGDNEGEETGSWITVEGISLPGTYDLLTLVNGVLQELGEITLEAGHYTQIRLLLGGDEGDNYVITKDAPPQEIDLQISSQDETGIKLTKGFDIESGVVTELILDWDMEKSIMKKKNPLGYKLKPTIKILDVEVASNLSGTVTGDDPDDTDSEATIPIEGALVTAQVVDTEDPNLASVVASTITDAEGGYRLIVEEGEEEATSYNIVVYTQGYSPACATIEVESATDVTENFVLTSVNEDLGIISGNVAIPNQDPDITYEISIQQDSDCGKIVISYNSVVDGDEYSATLPAGDYYIVGSTIKDGVEIQELMIEGPVSLESGEQLTDQDVEFLEEEA